MNKDRSILIHDVASLTFLAPFSVLCLADVLFGYTVYPMFLTHALTVHMSYDLLWITLQPKVVHTFRKLIMLHHIVVLTALLRPLMYPDEAFILSYAGLVEIDTSLLTILISSMGGVSQRSRTSCAMRSPFLISKSFSPWLNKTTLISPV